MSSAILYVAIVAIWAGVLIPRWLRRDSAASERYSEDLGTAEAHAEPDAEPAPPPRRHQERVAPRAPTRSEARPEVRSEARPEAPPEARAEPPDGEPRDGEHKKMLAARRRLLYMLLVLAIGSGALAFTKMAAWWVMVPPTIMLLGYMGLLREAAKADAERRELARTRATAAAAVAATRRETAPAPPPPAPDAEVIDISARVVDQVYDQYSDAADRAVGD